MSTNYKPVNIIPPSAVVSSRVNLALTGVSQQLLAANFNRWRVIICNISLANVVFLQFGAAAALNQGLMLGFTAAAGGGGHFWDSLNGPVPDEAINVIGTAGQVVTAIEFVSDL